MDQNENNPYTISTTHLTEGFMNIYKAPLVNIRSQLKELTTKQSALISQIHQENLDLAEVQFSPEVQEMFKKMNTYHQKLVNIKKQMRQLHDRSTKLKKRATKLQQVKEKENLLKMQSELEIKRETELIGPGPSKSEESEFSS